MKRISCRVFHPVPKADPEDWEAVGAIAIRSEATVVGTMPRATTWEDIANEPSMIRMRMHSALAAGGPLLHDFIAALPADWRAPDADVTITVRRSDLDPGWNPTPVGWHIDGMQDGIVDLRYPVETFDQIIACCGPAAPTRFLLGEATLSIAPVGTRHASRWQTELEAAERNGHMKRWIPPTDTLVAFGWGGFHAGSVSETPGWRLFLKAMRGHGTLVRGGTSERNIIAWTHESPGLPTDPCGVFPDSLPSPAARSED